MSLPYYKEAYVRCIGRGQRQPLPDVLVISTKGPDMQMKEPFGNSILNRCHLKKNWSLRQSPWRASSPSYFQPFKSFQLSFPILIKIQGIFSVPCPNSWSTELWAKWSSSCFMPLSVDIMCCNKIKNNNMFLFFCLDKFWCHPLKFNSSMVFSLMILKLPKKPISIYFWYSITSSWLILT